MPSYKVFVSPRIADDLPKGQTYYLDAVTPMQAVRTGFPGARLSGVDTGRRTTLWTVDTEHGQATVVCREIVTED